MKVYRAKIKPFSGTRYADIGYKAYRLYNQIKKESKRRPYVRSAYFKKEKVFLELFWKHLQDKHSLNDKTRRLKYLPCAVELIQNSRFDPITKENPDKSNEMLHRFIGIAPNNVTFFVQIRESKRNKRKWLMSVFPEEK
jgi:hypothetical protein